jgi:hypothetical protein
MDGRQREGDLVTHQERTEKASRQGDPTVIVGALWAIAHSLAAIADALEHPPTLVEMIWNATEQTADERPEGETS